MILQKKIATIFIMVASIICAQEKNSGFFYEQAKSETKKNNFRKAADLCLEGLKFAPNDLDLTEYLGKNYLELNKLDSARYLLKKVVDQRKDNANSLRYLITTEQLSKRYSSAICYINELLQVVPYDRTLWLKKVDIYSEMGNNEEAINDLKRLKNIFPDDIKVKKTYNHFMLTKGNLFLKQNNLDQAKNIYSNIVSEQPENKEAYLQLIKSELLTGNKQNALNITERGLTIYPNDPILLNKKIGILEEQGRYDEAIFFAKKNNKNKQFTPTVKYLVNEASNFYKYRDPYELKKKEYEITKNKKALLKIINTAIGKGQNDDASYYIHKGLKNNAEDKDILLLQLNFFLRTNNDVGYEKSLDKLYKAHPDDTDVTEKYAQLSYKRAKLYTAQKDYKNAIKEYVFLSSQKDYKNVALENLFSIYESQNKYDQGLEKIDYLIAANKNNNESYFAKKSALYEKMGNYHEAIEISKMLMDKSPENDNHKNLFISESEAYVSFLMKNEQYDKALDIITNAILVKPTKYLNNQAINASVAVKDYERAITFAELGRSTYPNDKEFHLKFADIQVKLKAYNEAFSTLSTLQKKHPYNYKIMCSLSEVSFLKGKFLEQQQVLDSAIVYYKYSIKLGEKENPAIQSLINLKLQQKKYKEAINFIDGLPHSSTNLQYKKGIAYEHLKVYDSAYFYQNKYNPSVKEHKGWLRKMNSLNYKSFKNQLEFTYSQNVSDSVDFKSALHSLSYTRLNKKDNYSAEVNYVTRKNAVALQLNLGWSHIFSNTVYTEANYAISNSVFPKHKLSVAVFKSLKNDFEIELGARYTILNDTNLTTGILGLSKTVHNFWLNGKVFVLLDDDSNLYNNIVLQGRYLLDNSDYVSLILSTGTAPYDDRLDFQNNTFLSFVNTLVGFGYNKQVNKTSSLTANINWYNYEVFEGLFSQQTNFTISFKTRF